MGENNEITKDQFEQLNDDIQSLSDQLDNHETDIDDLSTSLRDLEDIVDTIDDDSSEVPFLDIFELSKLLKIEVQDICKLIKNDKIPFCSVFGMIYFNRNVIYGWFLWLMEWSVDNNTKVTFDNIPDHEYASCEYDEKKFSIVDAL